MDKLDILLQYRKDLIFLREVFNMLNFVDTNNKEEDKQHLSKLYSFVINGGLPEPIYNQEPRAREAVVNIETYIHEYSLDYANEYIKHVKGSKDENLQ